MNQNNTADNLSNFEELADNDLQSFGANNFSQIIDELNALWYPEGTKATELEREYYLTTASQYVGFINEGIKVALEANSFERMTIEIEIKPDVAGDLAIQSLNSNSIIVDVSASWLRNRAFSAMVGDLRFAQVYPNTIKNLNRGRYSEVFTRAVEIGIACAFAAQNDYSLQSANSMRANLRFKMDMLFPVMPSLATNLETLKIAAPNNKMNSTESLLSKAPNFITRLFRRPKSLQES